MKVINKGITGCLNGIAWPEVGGEFEVPDDIGADLAATGLVEVIAEKPKAEKRPARTKVETR